MIRSTPTTYHRAVGAALAVSVLAFTSYHASAQTVDLFGGTLGTPAMLTLVGNGANINPTLTGAFGPNYTGTLTEGLTAVSTLSEGFTSLTTGANATNAFVVSQTGVVSAAASTSASRTFTAALTPGATYALTLTRTTGFTVGLLSSVNISLFAGGTQFLTTASNPGLLGAADLLSLFGTNNVATFQFTVPTNATGALGVNIATTETAVALAGSYTFQSATINQVVPEPRTVATLLFGAFGLAVMRFRHRLRMA